MATQQATPEPPQCGFCNQVGPDLARFHSTELLDIAKEYDPNFTRRSLFCADCIASTERKFRRRKLYNRLMAKKARSGIDQSSRSYSNVPSSLPLSSESNRTRHQTGGNRNVAKRTGGPPRNPTNPPATGMEIDIPTESEEGSEQSRQLSSASSSHDSRQTTQSHTSNIDVGNDNDDDDDDNNGNSNGNGNYASNSVSSQAPMPSNQHLHSQTTSQPLTPNEGVMSDMSSAERAKFMRNHKRGSGG